MEFIPQSDLLDGIIRSFVRNTWPYVFVTPSSTNTIADLVSNIFDYSTRTQHWVSASSEGLKANIIFGLTNYKLRISHYSFRSHYSSQHYVRAWELSGSNNGIDYTPIHTMPVNDELTSNSIGHYQVPKGTYKYFKLVQTSNTLSGLSNMRVRNFELFGKLIPDGDCQKTFSIKLLSNIISMNFIFFVYFT